MHGLAGLVPDRQPRVQRLCLFVFVIVSLCSAWVADDAYITFRAVDLTLDGFGPRWNIAERVQVYSHPAWFFLLVLLNWLGMDLFWAAAGLGLALSAVTAWLLLSRARGWVAPVSVLALLCASKSFVEFSSSGLENPLCHLVVVTMFLGGLGWAPIDPTRRGAVLGLLVSTLALCRIDLLLLVAPLVGLLLWRWRSKPATLGWLMGLAPLAGWELWSLYYYGDLVPNTACAKLNHTISPALRLQQGLTFYKVNLSFDAVTVPATCVAAAVGLRAGGVRRATAVGLLLYLAYVWWIPGDFMAGRFHSTPFVLGVALLASSTRGRWLPLGALAVLALVVSVLNPRSPLRPDRLISGEIIDGVADERAYYYDNSRLELSMHIRHGGLVAVARRSGGPLEPVGWNGKEPLVVARWEGMVGYGLGPSVHLVDEMALSDPLLSRLRVVSQPWAPLRAGHLKREIPAGYLDSLRAGENLIEDPGIAALWADVAIATRAPLNDSRRLRAIAGTVLCGAAHRDRTEPP